jgi:hypothetical protein
MALVADHEVLEEGEVHREEQDVERREEAGRPRGGVVRHAGREEGRGHDDPRRGRRVRPQELPHERRELAQSTLPDARDDVKQHDVTRAGGHLAADVREAVGQDEVGAEQHQEYDWHQTGHDVGPPKGA